MQMDNIPFNTTDWAAVAHRSPSPSRSPKGARLFVVD